MWLAVLSLLIWPQWLPEAMWFFHAQARVRIGYYLTITWVRPELVDCAVRICENDYEWGGNFTPSLAVSNEKLLANIVMGNNKPISFFNIENQQNSY